jgi:mRNA interferase HigB
MRVVGLHHVDTFKRKHPRSRSSLDRWIKIIRGTDFKNLNELKKVFPSADKVGKKVVFNVGGNKIRAITVIEYGICLLVITNILTHDEYDKGKWKDSK